MAKKLRAFRLSEEAFMSIQRKAKEGGVSHGELIERWALIGIDLAKGPDVSVETLVEVTQDGPKVLTSNPVSEGILLGGAVLGKLTDRTNAKPLTRAVQMHQAKE